MQRLSVQAESPDIHNDLFTLIYLLHKQTLGDFDVLKEGRLAEGDKRDLVKIYIAQAIELVKHLKLSLGPDTSAEKQTYQILQEYLLAQYLQKNYFSSDEKEAAIGFAKKMLAACFDRYLEDQLTSEFGELGQLVSDNGIRLFYKKVEWGMDFKFDLNWSVQLPTPKNTIKAMARRWKKKQLPGAALEALPVVEEVYQQVVSSKPDYDTYYLCKKRENDQKLAKFKRDFQRNLLKTTYQAAFYEFKKYKEMSRLNWVGQFFGIPPANLEIAYSFLLGLQGIGKDRFSSSMKKIIDMNDLFCDTIEKLEKASSKRLLPIVSTLYRDFLQTLPQAGFALNKEMAPVMR